ncbi:MAG: hypothetical protein IBX46_06265 [Desulfuromonadales bacterium]|nr:hypothetical protein [Desulfuromonadales bacterium]
MGFVPKDIPTEESERFMRLMLDELTFLYEGNALRFGLRPLEVASWRKDIGMDQDDE